MATLFPNDVTGGLNVGQNFSMIGVIGIFCFREQVAERGIVGPGLNLRHLILGIQRRLYPYAGKLPAQGKRKDRGPILRRDAGFVASGQSGLDDTVRKYPELEKPAVNRFHGWSRGTLSWHQARTNLGLVPSVLIAYHLKCMLRRGAALTGCTWNCASHFHAHGRRIVIEGGVIIGFKRRPWFARFVRLTLAVSSPAAPNLHRGDHIDFGQMLTSNSRPSRKAHSFGR